MLNQKKSWREKLADRQGWVYLVLIAMLVSAGVGVYAYFMFREKEGKTSLENIENVRKKYEAQLMGLPNVNGVGIGEREGRLVIVVLVTHKTPEVEERIPKMLEGYKVVVGGGRRYNTTKSIKEIS